jgi:MYXO-CTERM domain-containing protein
MLASRCWTRRRWLPVLPVLASAGLAAAALPAAAATYEVGPGLAYTSIGGVPWESLAPGDVVRIHARPQPYAEKWVLCAQGTESQPIVVQGVPDGSGNLPIVTGEGATTRRALDFWGEERALVKIGGANVPDCSIPQWIVVEKLHLRRARQGLSYTGHDGSAGAYAQNAAALWVETGQHVTVRDCEIEDSGNGLFSSVDTEDLVVQRNYLHGNGNVGSLYEHNSYTAAHGILFEGNRYGPLCAGCSGNALKDRSAGTVIRANWIEGGNRQLDLVDCEDDPSLKSDPRYADTFVYANVLVETGDDGNSQIVHFGGDSGTTAIYRSRLWFWNNTVVSRRTGNTTLFRLSSPAQKAQAYDNVFYVTASGDRLALVDADGDLRYAGNWLNAGFVASHSGATGTLTDGGGNVTGTEPGFVNLAAQDYHLAAASPALDVAVALPSAVAGYPLDVEYVMHQQTHARPDGGPLDLGAFERETGVPPPPPPPPPAGTAGGCGTGSGAGPLALAAAAALALVRRRRRDGRPGTSR